MERLLLALSVLGLLTPDLPAWTDGELLIWMDGARRQGLEPTAKKFQRDFGIKVTIEAPQNLLTSFPIAALRR